MSTAANTSTSTKRKQSHDPLHNNATDTSTHSTTASSTTPDLSTHTIMHREGIAEQQTAHPVNFSPGLSVLLQSLLSYLQQPSYPLPIDATDVFYHTVVAHLPTLTHIINHTLTHSQDEHSRNTALMPVLGNFLQSHLPAHHLCILSSHLLYLTDQLLCRVLGAAGWPCATSIPLISSTDGEDEDEVGGMAAITGITGGSCKILPDAYSARLHVVRAVLNRKHTEQPIGQQPALLLPDIPNAHKWLDRLLFDLSLPSTCVHFIPIVPYPHKEEQTAKKQADNTESTQADSSNNQHHNGHENEVVINPLVIHHLNVSALQSWLSTVSSSAQQQPQPMILLTQLGSYFNGSDECYYYEHLPSVKEACSKYGVWLHVEGEMLWADQEVINKKTNTASTTTAASIATTPTTSEKKKSRKKTAEDSTSTRSSDKDKSSNSGAGAHSQSNDSGDQHKRGSKSLPICHLYTYADSICTLPTDWFHQAPALAVAVFKDSSYHSATSPSQTPRSSTQSVVGPRSFSPFSIYYDNFPQLFSTWFALSSIPSPDTLLSTIAINTIQQLTAFKQTLLAQSFTVHLIAPIAGEGAVKTAETAVKSPASRNTIPSHPHLFFQLSVPPPLDPSDFNLTLNDINTYIAYRLALRLNTDLEHGIGQVLGTEFSSAKYFDLCGFLYKPAPHASALYTEEQLTHKRQLWATLFTAMQEELSIIVTSGQQRAEFQHLLQQSDELVYVDIQELQHQPRVGLGAFRFIPTQLPVAHQKEVAIALNKKLKSLANAQQHPWPTSAFPSHRGIHHHSVSVYRAAMDKHQQVCTIIDITPLLLTRGVKGMIDDVLQVIKHLTLPKRVLEDVRDSVVKGIKEAEKKLDEVTQQNYAPTNLVRWLPLVGPVINYWSPRPDKDTQAASMTGQSFDLRKKELNVIRYSYENQPAAASNSSNSSTTPVQTPTHAGERPQSALSIAPGLTQSSPLSSTVSAPVHTKEAASHPAAGASPDKAHKETLPPQSPGSLFSRSASAPRSHSSKTSVTVAFDDQERAILKQPFAHKSLAEVIDYLSKGVVLTSHFPPPADEIGHKAQPTDNNVMVADLLIFYVSHYTGDADESLGRGPILAWCEPTERYVSADQAVAIEHVTELHLGKSHTFPQGSNTTQQAAQELCLSLVTPQVSLYLHAHSKGLRDEVFLALYILLSSHHTIIKTDRTSKPVKAHKRGISAAELQSAKPSGAARAADLDVSASTEGSIVVVKDVHQALSILTTGLPFIVYVLDKQDVEISTRHEITLWFKPEATTITGSTTPTQAAAQSTAVQPTGRLLGYLCWCKRGAALVYSSTQSLPISSTVQICLGRQTKALRNEAARSAAADRCFSIMVDKMILNLEALSNEARSLWLACFDKVMINAGKTRVFEEQLRQRAPASQIQVVT